MFSPEHPNREACHALLAELLGERSGVLQDEAPYVRWRALGHALNETLVEPFWAACVSLGLVPVGWSSPTRGFYRQRLCEVCQGFGFILGGQPYSRPCERCNGRGEFVSEVTSTPPGLRVCLPFAMDPVGAATAEANARRFVHRLAPWCDLGGGAQLPRQCHWRVARVGDRPAQLFLRRKRAYLSLILVDAVSRACLESRERYPPLPDSSHALQQYQSWSRPDPALARAGHAAWQALSRQGAVVPEFGMTGRFPRSLSTIGQRFSALDDPFEPLVGIWDAGYALEDFSSEAILMVAPG